MNETFLLKRGWPMTPHCRFDSGASVANHKEASLIFFFNPALSESLDQGGHDSFTFAAPLLEIQGVFVAFTINSNRQNDAQFTDPDPIDLDAEEVEFVDRPSAQEFELFHTFLHPHAGGCAFTHSSLGVTSDATARDSFAERGDNFSEEIALTGSCSIGRQLYFAVILVADSRSLDLLSRAIDVGTPGFTPGPLIVGLRGGEILGPAEAIDFLFHGGKQPESDRGSQHVVEKFAGLGFVALQEGRFQFLM